MPRQLQLRTSIRKFKNIICEYHAFAKLKKIMSFHNKGLCFVHSLLSSEYNVSNVHMRTYHILRQKSFFFSINLFIINICKFDFYLKFLYLLLQICMNWFNNMHFIFFNIMLYSRTYKMIKMLHEIYERRNYGDFKMSLFVWVMFGFGFDVGWFGTFCCTSYVVYL